MIRFAVIFSNVDDEPGEGTLAFVDADSFEHAVFSCEVGTSSEGSLFEGDDFTVSPFPVRMGV